MKQASDFDVIVIGGGPAGMSTALVLARCRRRVLVLDAGEPRNAASHALHGLLTRDGIPPLEYIRLGRADLARYDVHVRAEAATSISRRTSGFTVRTSRSTLRARILVLATGVKDLLPAIPGMRECYGTSVFHCPYCDGWEMRDRPLAAFGSGGKASGLALLLRTWSADITLFTNGTGVPAVRRAALRKAGIPVVTDRVVRLRQSRGTLESVDTRGGSFPCTALFFNTGQIERTPLAARLGCAFTARGVAKTDRFGHTNIPNVYVVGDASRDVQFVSVAVAEGAKAAVAINEALVG